MEQIVITRQEWLEIDNICNGVYYPLQGFLKQDDYNSVLNRCRLAHGEVWSIPIVIRLSKEIPNGEKAELVYDGEVVAVINDYECYFVDLFYECSKVFGTVDPEHPGVDKLLASKKEYCIGGKVGIVKEFPHEYPELTMNPTQTKLHFMSKGWRKVVGFQTRNPLHKAHEYLLKCSVENTDGLFLNPLHGWLKSGDIPNEVRIETYEETMKAFPEDRIMMGLFPFEMRYAGPREAILHAIVRRNYGCTHFIVGRDHAGVGKFYGTYDAQRIFDKFPDIGIEIIKYEHAFYCKKCKQVVTAKTCPHGKDDWLFLSGTEVRRRLEEGEEIPEEFSRPEIIEILRKYYLEKA